ncbi:substrate-binding domain-containing protein [Xylophilus rhododendri]|uniref:Substrate-binding domain-containing protein n=1 Tax=Xylophilus rhododendri TaxID=2697032 RepID=A0A857J9X9_9BURK|nr:LacI family DNA-binding transcriptional regulator [Xylophilus rhododendri]QHJ00024.1 substrate-binding domain-containing protein [Xylophilus rhododendri]
MSEEATLPPAPARRPRRGSGRATLADVARVACVSAQTVSRVVNAPASVPPATVALVRQAIAQVGYVPNLLAGGLASGRSRLVAALVPAIAGPVFQQTIEALSQTLAGQGYQLMLGESGFAEPDEAAVLLNLIGRRPDGIVLTRIVESPAARALLAGSGLPVVETWDLSEDPVDMLIGFSHAAIGAAVADYFFEQGFRRPALLTGDDPRAGRRAEAFAARLRTHGLLGAQAALPTVQVHAPAPLGAGRRALGELLARHPGTDAVFCSTDMIALGVLIEARERGLRVPQDLAVMGFGDLAFAADTAPALTTVRVDGAAIGRTAAQWVMARAERREAEKHRLDIGFEIVRRHSA